MAPRRLRRESQLAFEALTIEGGLLSPEWLAKVAQLEAPQQTAADYGIEKGLQIRDEIGRYWRIAEPKWRDFAAARASGADTKAAAVTFITELLAKVFGFDSLTNVGTLSIGERAYPLGWSALDGKVPVVIASPLPSGEKDSALDKLAVEYGEETRRRTPFGLCQEFLNASEGAMWGVASDGLMLRVLRDNVSLTRPAWLEADLQAIFTGGRFSDFAALWLLLHQSRFGRTGQPPSECPLEQWRTLGREEGTRARAQLRDGVEDALRSLGQGFLEHRDNQALRTDLEKGRLTEREYFQQLLRLVYRIIFVLTVEERGLLHPDGTSDGARALYNGGYSLRRLRERVVRRSTHDRNHDAWEALKVVFKGLAVGQPALGLPALAGIFAQAQCPALDAARIENRYLLQAVRLLSWILDDSGLVRVNWRDMGPEELGSVYESLLELTPRVTKEGREFTFADGSEGKGNARKTSGSYYTPDSLVQVLLDSALNPVMERAEAKRPDAKAEALLELSVVDPACGSGHFLLAAARRIAARIAQHEAKGTASPKEYRHAMRRVVGRCIFGVDLNPLAVELCKVGLWMEAVEPGLPLSFLDSHVQCGNALFGTTRGMMENGIPDEAWTPIGEDDKKTASALRKRNKLEASQEAFKLEHSEHELQELTVAAATLDQSGDDSLAALARKEAQFTSLRESSAFAHQLLIADAWCSAFVWPKTRLPDELAENAPTNAVWRRLQKNPNSATVRKRLSPSTRNLEGTEHGENLTISEVDRLSRQYRFFHWQLAFPQVFSKGGFDLVLGNPPWDMNEIKDDEFFAESFPDVLSVKSAKDKAAVIKRIETEAPSLFAEYKAYRRTTECSRHWYMSSGRYPKAASGRVNLYRLFLEHACATATATALVIPSGFVSDAFSQPHFVSLHESGTLERFYDFENSQGLFDAVHRGFRFALIVTSSNSNATATDFVFYATTPSDLAQPHRHVPMEPSDLALVNPMSRTAPLFRTRRDQSITLRLHRASTWLGDDSERGWKVQQVLMFMVNAALTSHRSADELMEGYSLVENKWEGHGKTWLPLYEGKMVAMYDHRGASVVFDPRNRVRKNQANYLSDEDHADPARLATPLFWLPEQVVRERRGPGRWLLAVKDVTAATNERTCIAAVLPDVALADSVPWLRSDRTPTEQVFLLANLNSMACDYAARQKVAGLHLRGHYLDQLPVLLPSTIQRPAPWSATEATSIGDWVAVRTVELSYTAWDLAAFGADAGFAGSPFRWEPERRALIQAELDAAFFHLYGLSREDTDYVLETFPIVKKNDEKKFGEYRTKRLILERYDALGAASRTGDYKTPLHPPPAHPSMRHAPRPRQE